MNLPSLTVLGPIWGGSELLVAVLRRSRSDSSSKDRGSFFLIWCACLSSIATGVFLSERTPAFFTPARKIFYLVGFGVFIAGLALRVYSILYLGRFFTSNIAIAADHRLIDSGPYRFIRHPTYTGMILIVLGIGLSLANLASLVIVVVPILGSILWRISLEEKALSEAFGDQYRQYTQRTKRLLPWIY